MVLNGCFFGRGKGLSGILLNNNPARLGLFFISNDVFLCCYLIAVFCGNLVIVFCFV